jgi:hypothetical protein
MLVVTSVLDQAADWLAGSRLNQIGERALKLGDKPESTWLDRVTGDHGMEEVRGSNP